jgi:hypothetical protein
MLRVIYFVQIGEMAQGPGGLLGTISGRSALLPAIDCPDPGSGARTPLTRCATCTNMKGTNFPFLDCDYEQSQRDRDQLSRVRGVRSPMEQVGHPGVQPPVPPGVHEPKKK